MPFVPAARKKRASPPIPPLFHPPRRLRVVTGNCAPCIGLAGQDAGAPAHPELQALGKLTLEGGRYDRLFMCTSCGRDWVVEHGPGGKGWV